jgi:hypothetical protein
MYNMEVSFWLHNYHLNLMVCHSFDRNHLMGNAIRVISNATQTGKSKRNSQIQIKCTFVQALRFCTGRTAHRGSRDIPLRFLDCGTRRGEGSASRPRHSLPPEMTQYPLYPGPVWRGAENLVPAGIRIPDGPARS